MTHQVDPAEGQADLHQDNGQHAGQDAESHDDGTGHKHNLLAGCLKVNGRRGEERGGGSSSVLATVACSQPTMINLLGCILYRRDPGQSHQ
jgi:hypothetical protein